MSDAPGDGQRVVAVTGGGGGIGAAVAEELGRQGAFVVTMDPLVSLDGTELLPPPEETTAGRIVAAGGAARATSVSVTDGDAVRELFAELGRIDAVINVAGISRPTSFARGSEEDWHDVLDVHLGGYLELLRGALPMMAAAGHGRILGVTSGSGWRAADAGAYSCAKRAVAALTWQLGRVAPAGVVVNAMSPIAVTRMVTAALGRAPASAKGSSATGGLSLGSMPQPEDLAPFGAHLVGEGFTACQGRVLFAGGSEVAVIDEPRLLEVVRTDGGWSLADRLDAVTGVLAAAEGQQVSTGGSNPRLRAERTQAADARSEAGGTCVVVSDRSDVAAAVTAALEARGVACRSVPPPPAGSDRSQAVEALSSTEVDGVVVALAGPDPAAGTGWRQVLDEHADLPAQIELDAGWARAVADRASELGRSLRLVTLTDARTAGGRSRAQAAAQLARASRGATEDRVAAFSVALEPEASVRDAGELAAHLLTAPDAAALSGAELAAGAGWIGVRSHPRPSGSVLLGGAELPAWLDDVLARIVGDGDR